MTRTWCLLLKRGAVEKLELQWKGFKPNRRGTEAGYDPVFMRKLVRE